MWLSYAYIPKWELLELSPHTPTKRAHAPQICETPPVHFPHHVTSLAPVDIDISLTGQETDFLNSGHNFATSGQPLFTF